MSSALDHSTTPTYIYIEIKTEKCTDPNKVLLVLGQRTGAHREDGFTGRKAKRMVLQCINGVGSNPVEGRTKI
jgi:hypothetical protein